MTSDLREIEPWRCLGAPKFSRLVPQQDPMDVGPVSVTETKNTMITVRSSLAGHLTAPRAVRKPNVSPKAEGQSNFFHRYVMHTACQRILAPK